MKFAFEDTPVYQLALQLNLQFEELTSTIKYQTPPFFLDQLRRASLSICNNIAEGYGRWHKADKQNFYRIARGSVFECIPMLQILKLRSLIGESDYETHYAKLQELAKMLSG